MGTTDTTQSAIDPLAPFACAIRAEPELARVTVVPRGELDVATVPQLQRELDAVLAGAPATLLLDLGELSFVDSSGLHLLLRAAEQTARAGVGFELIEGTGPAARLLRLTNLSRRFARS